MWYNGMRDFLKLRKFLSSLEGHGCAQKSCFPNLLARRRKNPKKKNTKKKKRRSRRRKLNPRRRRKRRRRSQRRRKNLRRRSQRRTRKKRNNLMMKPMNHRSLWRRKRTLSIYFPSHPSTLMTGNVNYLTPKTS
jgi:hypothetical protein